MALIFLLLLTLIGITALNTTSLEEKMAGNVKDRNLAFQAAESALALGENWLYTQLGKPIFPNNGAGLYAPSTGTTENWQDSTWSGSNLVIYPNLPGQSGSGTLGKINTQPKYIIEDMGEVQETSGSLVLSSSYKSKGTTILRVTARGTGGTDAAVVMLQSTYARDY
ncbi:MAG: pilus assembly protein PilX [Gammaproteobacteria bacterium]|nr:pilus assembly protein PilX [Gammaproteobacteria bacterium]